MGADVYKDRYVALNLVKSPDVPGYINAATIWVDIVDRVIL